MKQQLFKEIELFIRNGEHKKAFKLLESLNISKLNRQDRLAYSRLARRSGLAIFAIKALNPVIRSNKININATDSEKLEYAASLLNLSLNTEARDLLAEIDESKIPDANLYQAFCWFKQWDYHQALPYLYRYISQTPIESYEHIVGQVNLLAALVSEREYSQIDKLSKNLIKSCKKKSYQLLLGNIHELSAQSYYFRNDFDQMQKSLNAAQECLEKTKGTNFLFVEKWRAILLASKTKQFKEIDRVYIKASKLDHFETMRSLDYYKAKLKRDKSLMGQVYWGTPHLSFKKRILEENTWFSPDENNIIGKEKTRELNLKDLELEKSTHEKKKIKAKSLNENLIKSLCSDLYMPHSSFSLFQKVYPDEHFNPQTSLLKIYQLISRFNKRYFDKSYYICSVNERYLFSKPIKIIYSSKNDEYPLSNIKQVFGESYFTCVDLEKLLNISKRSAQRVINELIDKDKLYRTGKGKKSQIRLIPGVA